MTTMTPHPHLSLVRTRHPRLDPVVCLPWCEVGDGHGREWHVDDQACRSGHPGLDLGDDVEVGAYALHGHHEPVASRRSRVTARDSVAVYILGKGREVYLTRAEALQLAEEIRDAALLLPGDVEVGDA